MADFSYDSRGLRTESALATAVMSLARRTIETLRLWRHNHRSRQELASYSFLERKDVGYAADVEAEIAKPFWKK